MVKRVKKQMPVITTLRVNRLKGRMLQLPAPPGVRRNILIVYGLHGSIDRWQNLAEEFGKYGHVTMPDLPGLGGMQSFYHIGDKPTLDRMADYLAALVKLKYKNKRLTVVGISAGFAIVTRMCQKYPDVAKKVDVVISMSGLTHGDDYAISSQKRALYRFATAIGKNKAGAFLARIFVFSGPLLSIKYAQVYEKLTGKTAQGEPYKRFYGLHKQLWACNDLRTHLSLTHELLRLNNCRQPVDVPLLHVMCTADTLLNTHTTEQHMRVVFNKARIFKTKTGLNVGLLIESDRPTTFIPQPVRQNLSGS